MLRLMNQQLGSYLAIKNFVLGDENLQWRDLINFGEPKSLLDIQIRSEGLDQMTNSRSGLFKKVN